MKLLTLALGLLLSFSAIAANEAVITFTPTTTYTDGTTIPSSKVITYDLYQGLKGAAKVKVGSFTSGGKVTTGLLTGNEYCWDVVAIVDATPSAHSSEGCKKFSGTPSAVTITVD